MNEKLEKIIEIVKEYVDPDVEEISGDSQLISDIGLDSISFFSIIDDLEQEFDVVIEDSQLENLRTVGDMLGLVE